MKIFKNRKAQQLVEFLLVAPFVVIFLGILTEYAYALNCNMTLTQGLKDVTSSIYKEIKPDMTTDDIRNLVKTDLETYIKANNVPVGGDYVLDVGYNFVQLNPANPADTNSVFIASYTYTPAFTLPNAYFHILPDKFTFMATSSIPTTFLISNNYGSAFDSLKLDRIWSSSADFSSLDSFNDSKHGIMTKTSSDTVKIIFLVPTTEYNTSINPFSIVSWGGQIIDTRVLNANDGYLYNCDYTGCTSSGTKFMSAYSNYYNFIFVHDSEVNPDDLSQITSYWIHAKNSCVPANNPPCAAVPGTAISASNVDGILKRTLAIIIPPLGMSSGNFDNLNVFPYNPNVAMSNLNKIDTFGSVVFTHILSDNISNLINGMTPPVNSYSGSSEFGSKVNP